MDGDASADSAPTAWQNMLSEYSSTVSKVKTVVRDALALVKSSAGGGSKSETKKTSEAKSVDEPGYIDASAMRRHDRVLELLHAGSEMGYPLAMVCQAHSSQQFPAHHPAWGHRADRRDHQHHIRA